MGKIKSFTVDKLKVEVYSTRQTMGTFAAQAVAEGMKELIAKQGLVTMVFAAAPSQNEFLATLIQTPGIDWSKVIAFHLDEYIGLPEDAPQRFTRFLKDHLFDQVKPGKVYYIDGNTTDPEKECIRYGGLLQEHPIDIACIGIGENGHIAFNDPPVADFNDPKIVKAVEIDLKCRQQQVNDGCFEKLTDVPTKALTLTIPTIMAAKRIFCIVPGKTKSEAVVKTVKGEISTDCPASILRRHEQAILYLEPDSAEKLQ
ncbi:MAG TPA: glucosamine-6-phosphate deaminase [Firmicutes bacterium]|jgi:glucosamine-6-phosphate deaminase|nr:glucosamine-6-phosphate deaminase [Bacillota bacterium]